MTLPDDTDNSAATAGEKPGNSVGGSSRWWNDIHQGDARETLAEMPESSVHCVMTSPPYYGLRDYGVDGQIGLEDSLDEYIEDLVAVADELHRVLRPDGSWWLNVGDTFAGGGGVAGKPEDWDDLHDDGNYPDEPPARNTGLRRKSKMLVPHRVAIALQDAGWIVRADCPWVKPNPMPHPVKDRLHEHKEFVFHLVPEPDYWFDLDSIRESHAATSIERSTREDNRHDHSPRQSVADEETLDPEQFVHPNGKNPGDVFEVTVAAFPEAHFAVYPPELVDTPIKATAPEHVCVECGAPYERVVQRTTPPEHESRDNANRLKKGEAGNVGEGGIGPRFSQMSGQEYVEWKRENPDQFEGWSQQCDCSTDETEPGIVLDPFAGAGTTCMVAKRLGRRFAGIELNPEYVAMAQKRVGVTVDEPGLLLEDGETQLAAFTDGGDAGAR